MPATTHASLDEVTALLQSGEVTSARRLLAELAAEPNLNAWQASALAEICMHLNEPATAEPLYQQAVSREPTNSGHRYNLSTALISLGRMDEAEALLDQVIAEQPHDGDAWYNRSTLRRAQPQRNHVAAIRHALETLDLRAPEAIPLWYAMAREQEDLGNHAASFEALRRGADMRRNMLSYRVEDDEAMLQALASTFTARQMHSPRTGHDDPRPVFVLGLPRSGTTLVDRILSAHDDIDSHGESADFAVSLMQLTGQCNSKDELLQRSLAVDPAALGQAYCARLATHQGRRVVDKTPANFLYLGLLAAALPQARIVYVRRHPMDVCYAMYKTLFRMAYPFSYDLEDLGRYWLAFDRLMRHWQAVLPQDRMLVIDYEQLVTTPRATIETLLQHVDMPWQDACLHFHRNPMPTLTASAAQVRQPIYQSSVGLWRKYQSQLEPLTTRLLASGINLDDGAGNP